MLKIIKYDFKSVIIIPIFIVLLLLIFMIFTIISINNAQDYTDLPTLINLPVILIGGFLVVNVIVIGALWKKSYKDIELYEMAKISPLKVGIARMILVFIVITLVAFVFMMVDTIIEKTYQTYLQGQPIEIVFTNYNYYSSFSYYQLPWTNLLVPLFLGLYSSILFTTSFLFATVTRRVNHRIISAFILFGLIILYILFYYYVMRRINLLTPTLNLNKYGTYGTLIYRFELSQDSYLSIIYSNFLNIGLMIIYGLYVAIMFSVYSIRRKLV